MRVEALSDPRERPHSTPQSISHLHVSYGYHTSMSAMVLTSKRNCRLTSSKLEALTLAVVVLLHFTKLILVSSPFAQDLVSTMWPPLVVDYCSHSSQFLQQHLKLLLC